MSPPTEHPHTVLDELERLIWQFTKKQERLTKIGGAANEDAALGVQACRAIVVKRRTELKRRMEAAEATLAAGGEGEKESGCAKRCD